jgi:feruloyl esterase
MAGPLGAGYVVAGTDTGHAGGMTMRALHSAIPKGHRFRPSRSARTGGAGEGDHHCLYGRSPRHTFWNGCSTGGRQGLMEVQRYPEDFDGVVAGALSTT